MLTKYPNAGLVIGGDKNNLNIAPLLDGIPRVRQIVTQPTYRNKILDIMLTNMHTLYAVPMIVPPVPPDDATNGAPSDHSTPIATPIAVSVNRKTREYTTRVSRPLPDSGVREFGQWIVQEDWSRLTAK